MNDAMLEKNAALFKALGHPSRLTMVKALGDGDKCVCELRELVGLDLSTVSKHLSVLKAAGVVAPVKRGSFVYYHLKRRCVSAFIRCLETADGSDAQESGAHSTSGGDEACACAKTR